MYLLYGYEYDQQNIYSRSRQLLRQMGHLFPQQLRGRHCRYNPLWVYGPIMPYYYGLFFKIFGVHITSVLLGRALLSIVCSVFFYLSATCLMSPGLAFLGSAWFTQRRQEFFFTYNHIGGIAMELIILWCILSYLRRASMSYL